MTGVSQQARLAAVAQRLSERDQAIVTDVVRLRFLTAGQLARLRFAAIPQPVTRIRRVQRTLQRLVDLGLLVRCERRVGGVRAGSASFTYTAGAAELRVANLGFITPRYGFALYFQTRAGDWDRLQPTLQAFKDSFKAPA